MKKSEVLSTLICYPFEKEFIKFFNKFILKYNKETYSNTLFFYINNKIYMSLDLRTFELFCKYTKFWEFFEIKFKFNDIEIKYLIECMVKKYFKMKGTPNSLKKTLNLRIEEHLDIITAEISECD